MYRTQTGGTRPSHRTSRRSRYRAPPHAPARERGEVRRAILARAVQVEHRRGQHQHQPRAARRGGQRAEHADPRPAPLPRAQEDPDRQRQVQRLGVVRREVERHRGERRDDHRQPRTSPATRARRSVVALGAPELERGQAMDAVQREGQRDGRQQHAGQHRRHAECAQIALSPRGYSGKKAVREEVNAPRSGR